jgi:hypothetical protein
MMKAQRMVRLMMLMGALGVLHGGMIPPAMAQQLVLYDDFSEPYLNPANWTTSVIGGATVFELTRAVKRQRLTLGIRGYARTDRDTDIHEHLNQLRFARGDFWAIQFDTRVESYNLTGCSVPGTVIGAAIVQMQLVLFNDGSRTSSSDRTGDVIAYLRIYRPSDSTAPLNVLVVFGQMTRCENSSCSQEATIGAVSLGQILLRQAATFTIIWDGSTSRVLYYRDDNPEMAIPYPQSPMILSSTRTFSTYTVVPNCTATPRPVSEITALFDNIEVVFFNP